MGLLKQKGKTTTRNKKNEKLGENIAHNYQVFLSLLCKEFLQISVKKNHREKWAKTTNKEFVSNKFTIIYAKTVIVSISVRYHFFQLIGLTNYKFDNTQC